MNGVLFGPWIGTLVNAAGIVVAAIIGYVVALRTSKLLDIESTVQRLPNWVRHFKIGSPMFLIVVRIIPGLGGTIATQTAAALRVPIWRQIYTMSAIAIPICTALAIGGDALANYIDGLGEQASAYAERHHVHIPHRHHAPDPRTRGDAVKVDLVADPLALAALCERIVAEPRIALDTEFHTEKHFTPETDGRASGLRRRGRDRRSARACPICARWPMR